MNDYNGFTGTERTAAGRVKRAAQKIGAYPYPTRCEACGQSEGVMHSHNEDYADPFDAYEICYNCHMMLHCRFNNVFKWRRYLDALKEGAVFSPSADWQVFKDRFFVANELKPDAYGLQRPSVWLSTLPTERTTTPPDLPDWARSAHWRTREARETASLFD